MTTERCREWRESLGAYALGHLPAEERAAVEAHLQGCPECRAEAESLEAMSQLLSRADPARFGPAPSPPAGLDERIAARIEDERRGKRRRRARLGLALSGGAAAVAIVLAAIFVGVGGDGAAPARHVSFGSLPAGMEIGATLEPHAYGTEVHVYVSGAPSGALCRVFLRSREGARLPAGSFRYRWGEDSLAVLSSALDLSRAEAIGVRVGARTFVARL
jgi:anti-sigma factor RsiW